MGADRDGDALDCSVLFELELNPRWKGSELSIVTTDRTVEKGGSSHFPIITGLAVASPGVRLNMNDIETLMSVFAGSFNYLRFEWADRKF